tara:strand:- start:5998 stop:6918 length:921 start_codon:yes stop_codon:yes gene_type:complete
VIPSDIHHKKILYSALNWGMGHVSRSIGMIQQLEKNGNTIYMACSESQKRIFVEYLPKISFIPHEDYPFRFKGKGSFEKDLIQNSLKLRARMRKEERDVEIYLSENKIDLIISDHRYGFRSEKTPSIFITHQLNLPLKWYASFVQKWHEQLMGKFDAIWVLDFENSSLAGELSKNKSELNVYYIGPYSRFMFQNEEMSQNGLNVLIASGPTVYAQQFINENLALLNREETQVIAADSVEVPDDWCRVSNDWKEQDVAILNAKKIISRSGYSTLMDLHFLQKPFSVFPTKGQAEQEYLAQLVNFNKL